MNSSTSDIYQYESENSDNSQYCLTITFRLDDTMDDGSSEHTLGGATIRNRFKQNDLAVTRVYSLGILT